MVITRDSGTYNARPGYHMNPVVKRCTTQVAGREMEALPLQAVARSILVDRMKHASVLYRGETNPVGLPLEIVRLWSHVTGTRSLVRLGMLRVEMFLVQIAATPLKYTAITTQHGVVCLSAMSRNALSLCIGFAANIAQVRAITSSKSTCASWSSRRPR